MIAAPILLLDDDTFALKLLARQLAMAGAEKVDSATSGPQALALLEASGTKHEIVFLDLNMPDMDGVEFVRHLVLRAFSGTLVLVSGEDPRIVETVERLARGHQLNVLGHLTKPVQPAALHALLRSWSAAAPRAARSMRKSYAAEELRQAIARDELVNFYQPKVEIATGAFCGVESLVRWRHPADGLVLPDQFIGTAETHHLIDALTCVVLSNALALAREWRQSGTPLRVAVNVSMDNLMRLDFAELVVAELKKHEVPAADLVLEVTESRLMENMLAPLDILTRLRLKRVGLSIDDFGTGHSSLAQLRDLPFDELKIDRSFVHAAPREKTRRAILGASIGMAHELGMKTVAEGVEDRDDWECLRGHQCDLAQGYFIGKPMPAGHLRAWLAEWEQRRSELAPQ